MAEGRVAVYGEKRLPIQENTTIAEAKEGLAVFYPEIRNMDGYIDEDNNIKFIITAGSKGC